MPAAKTQCIVIGLRANSGANLANRKPPALIIPACRKAVTGVGAYRESGSHMWKGNCADLLMALMKMTMVIALVA